MNIENELSNNNGKIIKLMEEINRLFNLFNHNFYKDELIAPMLLVQANAKKNKTMGWCTTNKIWKDNTQDEYYYEITISADFLYRDIESICSTLLHEMVHLYCCQKDIKDTSRGNTYHNSKFKDIAEQHGLIILYDKRIGWSITKLNDTALELAMKNANPDMFVLTRRNHKGLENITMMQYADSNSTVTKKSSTKRYMCPNCGVIVRATKEVNIICGECDIPFEEKYKEE